MLPPCTHWQGWNSGACISEDMCYANGDSVARVDESRICSTTSCNRSSAAATETEPLLYAIQTTLGYVTPDRVMQELLPLAESLW